MKKKRSNNKICQIIKEIEIIACKDALFPENWKFVKNCSIFFFKPVNQHW